MNVQLLVVDYFAIQMIQEHVYLFYVHVFMLFVVGNYQMT